MVKPGDLILAELGSSGPVRAVPSDHASDTLSFKSMCEELRVNGASVVEPPSDKLSAKLNAATVSTDPLRLTKAAPQEFTPSIRPAANFTNG